MKKANLAIVFILFSVVTSPSYSTEISAYFIGNSLSWDAINGGAMVDLFDRGGVTLKADYHIRCGSSLADTYASSDDPCLTPPGNTWNIALPEGAFDLLIVQPHESGTTENEIAAIQAFSEMNAAQLVIYEAYPGISAANNLAEFYNQPDQNNFAQTRAEFLQVRGIFPEAIYVPAMDVLLAFEEQVLLGVFDGINSAQDIYRDGRHLNNIGKYILGLTFYTSLTGLDPRETGVVLHERYSGVGAEDAIKIQNIVAETAYVPAPAGFWMLLSALLSLLCIRYKKKQ